MFSHVWLAAPRAERRRAARGRLAACLVAAAVLAPSTVPADTGPLTLADALSRALAGGATARIARLEAHQASDALGEMRGSYLPQLGVSSEAGWSNRLDETFTAIGTDSQPTKLGLATLGSERGWLNVYVTQILFDLKQWRLIEREELAAEAAALAESRERDDVAFEVTRRYADVVRLQRRAALEQELRVDAQWLRERADRFFEAGRALELDHSLVTLHHEETELEVQAAAHALAIAREQLWIAVGEGEAPAEGVELAPESLPGADDAAPPEAALAESLGAAPELRILDLRRRMEDAAVAAARAGRLPTLKFVSGYTNYGPKRYDNFTDEVWVGVDLEIPIFDGFQSRHAIRGAERGAEIARLRYQSKFEFKRARVREFGKRLEMGRQRLEIVERRARAAQEQQRLADVNLRAERGGLRESLAAREERARLARKALDAELGQIELWASLQRELGRLTDEILGSTTASPPGAP
jgi:outer membrane protein TolC